MRNVLIIEDDESLISLMKHYFKKDLNTQYVYCQGYAEGMSQISNRRFDLYIIDINLGVYSGLDLLRILQKEKNIDNRVIIVSADKEPELRVQSYDLGASNFLIKPLNFDILTAVLRKNLRSLDNIEAGKIELKGLIIEPNTRSCFVIENDQKKEVQLTLIEFNILYKLARSRGVITSKEDLSFLGKDQSESMSFKAVEMHIASLRKKIGEAKIETKRGFGYYLNI